MDVLLTFSADDFKGAKQETGFNGFNVAPFNMVVVSPKPTFLQSVPSTQSSKTHTEKRQSCKAPGVNENRSPQKSIRDFCDFLFGAGKEDIFLLEA